MTLGGLAALAVRRGSRPALDLYEHSLAAFEAIGDRAEEARILSEIAWTHIRHGDRRSHAATSSTRCRPTPMSASMRGVGLSLIGLAAATAIEDRPEEAVQIAAAAEIYAQQEGIVNVYSDETPGARVRRTGPSGALCRRDRTSHRGRQQAHDFGSTRPGHALMAVLVLSQQEVEQLLDMEGCIEAMADALASLARGEVHMPLRFIFKPGDEPSLIGLMPAHRAGGSALYSLKTVCVFPDNPQRGLDAHQGTVTLFDGETGEVQALMNASAITAIRTAAVSAVATRLLAREDARELGVLGAGVQARSHLEALRLVRDLDRVRIYSPTAEHAAALAEETGAEAVGSAEECVRGADVVVAATSSLEPVLEREWLKEGAHVNSVGGRPP